MVFVLGFSQALYVLAVNFDSGALDGSATGEFETANRIFRGWLALFRMATGEKPGWSMSHSEVSTPDGTKANMEQVFIYLLFVAFVILVFIVLLRLLISMFNETYKSVKDSRERIWRIQRGQFILMAERRLLMLCKIQHLLFKNCCWNAKPAPLQATTCTWGQRLLCHMWLGEVDEVSTKSYRDDSDSVRLMRKLELEDRADSKTVQDYTDKDFEKEQWTKVPGRHSKMFKEESLPTHWSSAEHATPAFHSNKSSVIRTKELRRRNIARLTNRVNAVR